MSRCDIFVIYDDVQYDKNSWRNRNRVLSQHGPVWLTVPVLTKGRFGQMLDQIFIDNRTNWPHKHLCTIDQAYSKMQYYSEYAPFFKDLYRHYWEKLLDLDMTIINFLGNALGITAKIVRSSELRAEGHKTSRIIDICRELGARAYISTNGAKAYLSEELFLENDIELAYQDYTPPVYCQGTANFVSHLSVLDLVFRLGMASMPHILSTSSCPFNKFGNYRGLRQA